ncbi:hypothetical protein [Breznakiella homolactica]|uniref:Uncharacterized protein n=1 Tax=Breznakiella homolactica TaxID=2798577 RepID=A0A7T7XJG7_9SPIR|nr:hypothetical protein [Breznakiella homolactica]QQO07559.1 hypothetical protein JFL75_11430 [Breznakiella homolactica]
MTTYLRAHSDDRPIQFGDEIGINFPADWETLRYQQGYYRFGVLEEMFDKKTYIRNNRDIKIGGIRYQVEPAGDGMDHFRFTAVTGSMSLVFRDSPSVKRFFQDISHELGAVYTWLYAENNYIIVLYMRGRAYHHIISQDEKVSLEERIEIEQTGARYIEHLWG